MKLEKRIEEHPLMASLRTLQIHSMLLFKPNSIWGSKHSEPPSFLVVLRPQFGSTISARINSSCTPSPPSKFVLRAIDAPATSAADDRRPHDQVVKTEPDAASTVKHAVAQLRATISAFPPVVFPNIKRQVGSSFAIGFCIATTFWVLAVKFFIGRRKSMDNPPGSVAHLVRRGQLRSDRRGITRPLKYDDPFNNPLVKVGKSNSTVEMCGKVYRLAPVTLTEEQQAIHQKRRSRAYQWKRPTIFLKEGDSIPPDVDPDTVRWIPANHPFATTANDIDEDLAHNNVRQKHGVPFRIQAEHEALQRKLEALQGEQKLNKLMIDSSNAKDFERAFKSPPKSPEQGDESFLNEHAGNSKATFPERPPNSSGITSSSEEMQNP
ncbi:multiple chloroplast division site [Parasponia andersonii]|uniref:Multiple chloroplast division site n=1 Tax=Parasponia andersonii TaxID=3476 RepID=A0A2P5A975_PARAD|nr:multiple chloroplast division site [Parasponia andersonii]